MDLAAEHAAQDEPEIGGPLGWRTPTGRHERGEMGEKGARLGHLAGLREGHARPPRRRRRRTAGETCTLLLAAVGRGASDSQAVRKHTEKDRGTTPAERVARRKVQ